MFIGRAYPIGFAQYNASRSEVESRATCCGWDRILIRSHP